MDNFKIFMSDLRTAHVELKSEILSVIEEVFETSAFIGGPNNKFNAEFERKFSDLIGTKYVVGCSNGSDALEISLRALGIGHGDEIIVPAMTWIATAAAVVNVGAKPVFVDISLKDFNICCNEIKKSVTRKTKAIIAVHLYGMPADLAELNSICDEYGLFLIEDCAQAHLARFNQKTVGTFGDLATFSFFPGKNLGAMGDAGCVVTGNPEHADFIRTIINHGQTYRNNHIMIGRNSRMDGLQAALLTVKMNKIQAKTDKRIKNALYYFNNLNINNVVLPTTFKNRSPVYHQFVIRCSQRDELRRYLSKMGIASAVHYPSPLPDLPVFSDLCQNQSAFINARELSKTALSIPVHAELNQTDLQYIVQTIKQFFI